MKKIVLALAASAMLVSACASAPEKIAPAYVSPIQYANYDCDQIGVELERVSHRVSEVAGQQRKKRNQDTAAVAVGVVIFWPALFFLMSDDNKEELARLKGEYEALNRTATEKKCPVAAEIAAAQSGTK